MLNRFVNFFRSPTDLVSRELRRAQNLHFILLGALATEVIFMGFLFTGARAGDRQAVVLFLASFMVFAGALFLIGINKRNSLRAANIFTGALWTSLIVMALFSGGNQSALFIFIGSVIVMAALVINVRQTILFAVASAGVTLIINLPSVETVLPKAAAFSSQEIIFVHALNFAILGFLSIRHIANSEQAFEQVENISTRFARINEALDDSMQQKEALADAIDQQKAALDAFALINGLAAKRSPMDQLLQELTTGLADKLEAGHVAIFILDESGKYAYLQAASSKAGQLLIEDDGYRLSVRKGTMLATSRELGLPEISFNIRETGYKIARPIPLPDMIANQNYPIFVGNQLIGMLNIQSPSEQMENPEKEKLMGMLAAQIAIIIQHNRYFQEARAYKDQLETISGQRISEAWQRIGTGSALAYRFDRVRVLKQGEKLPDPILKQLQTGRSGNFRTDKGTFALVAPIQLSGQVIGVIGYELEKERSFIYPEETAMLDTIASQISIALENARLYTETQQRAHNEQLIASVSNRIRESLDLETVLRSATLEIQQALDVEFAEIRLGTPGAANPDGPLPG